MIAFEKFANSKKLPDFCIMQDDMDEKVQVCKKLNIDLNLPAGFPEHYKRAVVKVMDLCSVKKQMLNPPEFVISVR
jgi:hypothetical protein